jgi:pimeloyl-ACP methyl ester carboxylesterase
MVTQLHPAIEEVGVGPMGLRGLLGVPQDSTGIVIFAHGSGSGRLSPRNNRVAAALRAAGLATLLLDLLTVEEEADRRNVFDIGLLASRLSMATRWVGERPDTARLVPGYFGASTGAAAALTAAAQRESPIAAVVSRGGRPDLALGVLSRVRAATLLIVGSLDGPVIDMNRAAYDALQTTKQLVIVKGAGHLFEEPGTLDEVIDHATIWFRTYLKPPRR